MKNIVPMFIRLFNDVVRHRTFIPFLLVAIFLLSASIAVQAQTQVQASDGGREFWLCYIQNPGSLKVGLSTNQYIFIASERNTSVSVEMAGLVPQVYAVTAGEVTTVPVPFSMGITAADEGLIVRKSIYVHALDNTPISVRITSDKTCLPDTTVCLPVSVLGNRYRVSNLALSSVITSEFAILAMEDLTRVTIQYARPMPEVPRTVILNRGEVYFVHTDPVIVGSDLNGTLIRAEKSIAVFVGHALNEATNPHCPDDIEEQLHPERIISVTSNAAHDTLHKYGDIANTALQQLNPNKNYIKIRRPQVPAPNEAAMSALKAGTVYEAIEYLDGLARPIQAIDIAATPNGGDVVQPIVYDQFGRQSTSYLPYADPAGTGVFKESPLTAQAAFYTTAIKVEHSPYPYSETVYDGSPLNRVLEQSAPGEAWQLSNHHTMRYNYRGNTSSEVYQWNADGSSAGTYGAGTLYVTETKDPNGHTTRSYTDLLGNVVMKSAGTSSTDTVTCYVYDDFGNLAYIITPKAYQNLAGAGFSESSSIFDDQIYAFKYDARQRLIKKKVPGAEWQYFVYNTLNNLVASQDGRQRGNDEWLFTKYDPIGRVVETGVYSLAASQATIQSSVDTFSTLWEVRSADTLGYTNVAFPVLSYIQGSINTVNYYDDYDFNRNGSPDYTYGIPGKKPMLRLRSLVTGSKVKVLDALATVTWKNAAVFYDLQTRVIETQSTNHLGETDIVDNHYDFPGKLLLTVRTHTAGSNSAITSKEFLYDTRGRLQQEYHQLVGGVPPVLLAKNEYNELGQLVKKNLHSESGSSFLQSVDYRYNIRGWLKMINDPNLVTQTDVTSYASYVIAHPPPEGITAPVDAERLLGIIEGAPSGSKEELVDGITQFISDLDVDDMTPTAVRIVKTVQEYIDHAPDNYNAAPDLFSEEILYEQGFTVGSGPATEVAPPQYNGNISGIKWRVSPINEVLPPPGMTNRDEHGLAFKYDALDRLQESRYAAYSLSTMSFVNGGTWTKNTGMYDEVFTYDVVGNMTSLNRNTSRFTNANLDTTLDNLSYSYLGNGNKLDAVNTTIPSPKPTVTHFSDGTSSGSGEYNYDGSANMTRDDNKGITSTTYNYMNLPKTISLGVGKSITFLYDATGTLLKKTVVDGSTTTTRDYVGGMEYSNGVLDFIATEEGRLVKEPNPPANAPLYYYEYALRDHLGSVRVTFKESTVAGLPEITGVEHYYAFGMRMGDATMNYEGSNKYRYNGKEYQSDLGLNWYYYGFRFHDPVVGRFPTMDPLSEYFHEQSTYTYADNNPVTLIDFMGMDGEKEYQGEAIVVTAEGNSGIRTVDLTWWDFYRGGSGGGNGSGGGWNGSSGGWSGGNTSPGGHFFNTTTGETYVNHMEAEVVVKAQRETESPLNKIIGGIGVGLDATELSLGAGRLVGTVVEIPAIGPIGSGLNIGSSVNDIATNNVRSTTYINGTLGITGLLAWAGNIPYLGWATTGISIINGTADILGYEFDIGPAPGLGGGISPGFRLRKK